MKRFAFAAATALLAVPAYADVKGAGVAETVTITPTPAYFGTWEGFYGGVSLGYGDFDLKDNTTKIESTNGAVGGFHGGYRWDIDQVVWGVEVSAMLGDVKNSTGHSIDRKIDLKGQVGYDMGDSLIYITAGPSWSKVSHGSYGENHNGWVAGVGYDYNLNNGWTIGGELLYSKYDKAGQNNLKLEGTTIALRASYKF